MKLDVILFVVEGMNWTDEDQRVVERLKNNAKAPVLLVINKMDKLMDKDVMLPHIETLSTYYDFTDVVPISARKGFNVKQLENEKEVPEALRESCVDLEEIRAKARAFDWLEENLIERDFFEKSIFGYNMCITFGDYSNPSRSIGDTLLECVNNVIGEL